MAKQQKSEFETLKEIAKSIGEKKQTVSPAIDRQVKPRIGKQIIHILVQKDIREKVKAGKIKYGTKLMSHNGRDPLIDLYQELIDAVFYLRQLIEENESLKKTQK